VISPVAGSYTGTVSPFFHWMPVRFSFVSIWCGGS